VENAAGLENAGLENDGLEFDGQEQCVVVIGAGAYAHTKDSSDFLV